ncbi:MAG: DUF3459 domain-containing protein [Chloroflexaceae bacterium]|nr:DUF3459 domain-containing protein [Chloroflexaceae bacterium]
MEDVAIPLERVVDPSGLHGDYGRDPERTPMQWDASPYAGFSTVEPWLPLADDYQTRNVVAQRDDSTSMLTLVRRLIALRHDYLALRVGNYRSLHTDNAAIFAYLRVADEQQVLVVLNFASAAQHLDLSSVGTTGTLLCTTHLDDSGSVTLSKLALRPDEGVVIVLG